MSGRLRVVPGFRRRRAPGGAPGRKRPNLAVLLALLPIRLLLFVVVVPFAATAPSARTPTGRAIAIHPYVPTRRPTPAGSFGVRASRLPRATPARPPPAAASATAAGAAPNGGRIPTNLVAPRAALLAAVRVRRGRRRLRSVEVLLLVLLLHVALFRDGAQPPIRPAVGGRLAARGWGAHGRERLVLGTAAASAGSWRRIIALDAFEERARHRRLPPLHRRRREALAARPRDQPHQLLVTAAARQQVLAQDAERYVVLVGVGAQQRRQVLPLAEHPGGLRAAVAARTAARTALAAAAAALAIGVPHRGVVVAAGGGLRKGRLARLHLRHHARALRLGLRAPLLARLLRRRLRRVGALLRLRLRLCQLGAARVERRRQRRRRRRRQLKQRVEARLLRRRQLRGRLETHQARRDALAPAACAAAQRLDHRHARRVLGRRARGRERRRRRVLHRRHRLRRAERRRLAEPSQVGGTVALTIGASTAAAACARLHLLRVLHGQREQLERQRQQQLAGLLRRERELQRRVQQREQLGAQQQPAQLWQVAERRSRDGEARQHRRRRRRGGRL